jgi:hypothetical protein
VDREFVCKREVRRYEVEPAFHKSRNRSDIPRQTIEPSDDERCPSNSTQCQCAVQLRTIVFAPANGFRELRKQTALIGYEKLPHQGALRVDPQAGGALAPCRDVIVRNEAATGTGSFFDPSLIAERLHISPLFNRAHRGTLDQDHLCLDSHQTRPKHNILDYKLLDQDLY